MKEFFSLLSKLRAKKFLSFRAIYFILLSTIKDGINALTLLGFISKLYGNNPALHYESKTYTYTDLYLLSKKLASIFHQKYGLSSSSKIAIISHNTPHALIALFASSRLGSSIYMLNPSLSPRQITALINTMKFDFWIYDDALEELFNALLMREQAVSTYHYPHSIEFLLYNTTIEQKKLSYYPPARIIVLSGGTTGEPKAAGRSSSNIGFLYPFLELLLKAHLDRYQRVYIATPFYHGFGLSAVFIAIALGGELFIDKKFDALQTAQTIETYHVEIFIAVPLMIQRILRQNHILDSLKIIISGGAALNPVLTTYILDRLGDVLFNLYGTSEAGFCIMATPQILHSFPSSIGKPIRGVRLNIVSSGELSIKSGWSIDTKRWIKTGDIAYLDSHGNLFLKGRVDEMIISGGENVYPIELENILYTHTDILECMVIGINDDEFGQRLKAIVVKTPLSPLQTDELRSWIKTQVPRHLNPSVIEFRENLAYTPLGKPNKKII